jgi:hypothetical protein
MTMRLVLAETLKIRKNRGVVIVSTLMTLGVGVLVMVIPELYHLAHGSSAVAGGPQGLQNAAIALAFIGSIGAMIVGSAAGTTDLSTGVFRDLVATGRSRWSLFAARVPGTLLYWVPLVTLAYVVTSLLVVWFSHHGAGGCIAGAGVGPGAPGLQGSCAFTSGTVPPLWQFVDWFLWVQLYVCFVLLIAIGLASWVGSRATTLGVLIPFQLLVAPILSQVTPLGRFRQAFYPQALSLIVPNFGAGNDGGHVLGPVVTTSLATAWLVLLAWIAVMLGVGTWRTMKRDV